MNVLPDRLHFLIPRASGKHGRVGVYWSFLLVQHKISEKNKNELPRFVIALVVVLQIPTWTEPDTPVHVNSNHINLDLPWTMLLFWSLATCSLSRLKASNPTEHSFKSKDLDMPRLSALKGFIFEGDFFGAGASCGTAMLTFKSVRAGLDEEASGFFSAFWSSWSFPQTQSSSIPSVHACLPGVASIYSTRRVDISTTWVEATKLFLRCIILDKLSSYKHLIGI